MFQEGTTPLIQEEKANHLQFPSPFIRNKDRRLQILKTLNFDPEATAELSTPKYGVFVLQSLDIQKNYDAGGDSVTESREERTQNSSASQAQGSELIEFGHVLIGRNIDETQEDDQPYIPEMYDFERSRKDLLSNNAAAFCGNQNEQASEKGSLPTSVIRTLLLVNQGAAPVLLKEIMIYPPDRPQKNEDGQERAETEQVSNGSPSSVEQSFSIRHNFCQEWSHGDPDEGRLDIGIVVQPRGQSFVLQIKCEPKNCRPGFIGKWLILFLELPPAGSFFNFTTGHIAIGRRLLASASEATTSALLSCDARPFAPSVLRSIFDFAIVPVRTVQSEVMPFMPPILHTDRVPNYEFDFSIYQAYVTVAEEGRDLHPSDHPQLHRFSFPVEHLHLPLEDHLTRLGVLLMVEEAQMSHDIRKYDMFDQHIQIKQKRSRDSQKCLFATFTVPGATENRPRITYGDIVRIRPVGANFEIQSFVIQRHENSVTVQLPNSNQTTDLPLDLFANLQKHPETGKPTSCCHIGFTYSRSGLRFAHHGIHQILQMRNANTKQYTAFHFVLSPTTAPKVSFMHTVLPDIQPINPQINPLQHQCVQDILSGRHRPFPYIIFGPPGTGKTLTIIEAIEQIIKSTGHGVRVLACAPSDAAADIICSRLSVNHSPQDILRLNWWQREINSIPPVLLKYCHQDANTSIFTPPTIQELSPIKVVVSTCGAAGLLHLIGIPNGFFSHIFVDESSQALEPEVLIPLSFLGPDTSVILCGDPKQLGPLLRNRAARRWGLEVSLQERLMRHPLYQLLRTQHNPYITQLANNYRSHSSIIEVPNRLFYGGLLKECANRNITHSLTQWELLGPAAPPVIFYGVNGQDMNELDSPSFFNPTEASKVVELVKLLLTSLKVEVTTADIGIISAFRMQVLKLRTLLRLQGLGAINVGQVEDFQGQEQKIIFISTTLSSKHSLQHDSCVGLLNDPRKFNVAITRAKALLIVVGNPFLLSKEPFWKEIFQFSRQNNTYRGCPCPGILDTYNQDEDELFLQTVANLSLLGSGAFDMQYPSNALDYDMYDDAPLSRVILT